MKKYGFMGVLGLFWLLFSCDMFTPRSVEKPIDTTFEDPFRLYSILNKTGEQFSKTSYEDILDTNFRFIAWDYAAYTRESEIEQLKKLQASCNCDSISTIWDTCSKNIETRNDTSMTLCRTYFVTYNYSNSKVTDTGSVEFFLVRQTGNTWKISLWQENVQRSIFHP
jgi:hypothetical protein